MSFATASPGLKRAIDAMGSGYALAKALGISKTAIYQWTEIPLNRVPEISRLTGIPKGELRPEYATE